MIQVFAKPVGFDGGKDVLVGRGQHARRRVPRLGLAETIILSILEDPQQLGLQVQRQVCDLVQQQRAGPDFLEKSLLGLRCASERALDVAEQLRFEQLTVERRTVQGQEGFLLA